MTLPRASRLLFPVYERLTGQRPWSEFRQLQELQWRSADELEAAAGTRLGRLWEHAVTRVPRYRALAQQAGLGPRSVRSISDLARVPVSTRAELRAGFPEQVSAPELVRRGRRSHTSGSTGSPFEFYVDRARDDRVLASYLFSRDWAGAPLGLDVLYIAGTSFGGHSIARSSAAMEVARRVLFGERLVRLLTLEPDPFELCRRATAFGDRAYCVIGLPSYVARLAGALLEAGTALPARPRVVISQAETLTAADAARIEQAFAAPVVNHYSCWEMLHLAQSCPDNPEVLHVYSERAIVRVVRDDGTPAETGEVGRLLLTDLWNEVMPFINYDPGDRAALAGPCPCGRGLPTLTQLEGRVSELIRLPGGGMVSPTTLGRLLLSRCQALPYVLEYQAVQTAARALTLRLVPTARYTAEIGADIQRELEAVLGPDLAVELELVERVELEPSGKRLIIKSLLPTEPAG
jgi:phenylacetate-coenzyme A ligase PaaK-like adenylate-forming protein